MNALQYIEATRIEEIASQHQDKGYQVVVSPLELGAQFEIGSHSYDLIATKCSEKLAQGVTIRGESGKSVEQLMNLREQAHQEGFDSFTLTIASPPLETKGQIEGLDQEIFDYLVVNMPDQLAELPASILVESVGQIGISEVGMTLDGIRVVGSGVVEVTSHDDMGLENRSGRAKSGWEFAFPLCFDVELDHQLSLKHVHDIAADTGSFYQSLVGGKA
ncbi:MAG: hypothetical protein ACPGWR_31670 [Ardenticatenaceae bacterium]